ncbi:MAG TPA: 23S rRNA (adenine(2503)-C(2))-methyltransferase RlmN [Atribacteraceae bacterium]|nr:23S rRNA (adenine(2503)-C(2))-methyltransferase RlmN [Atribacteraceae bacterium]
MSKANLVGLLPDDLRTTCMQWGEPAFRTKQICDWVYRKKALSFQEMSNLSSRLRAGLAGRFSLGLSRLIREQVSRDGCRKYLLQLSDGETIESVLIPARNRITLCVSVQAGCPVQCPFCATGLSGFSRNLASSEIVEQVWLLERHTGLKITHLVFMGMGEPLLNYEVLSHALRVINSPDGLGIGVRHITISTIGIPEAMVRLAREWNQVNLALSLHAPNDHLRNRLVPINRVYPIQPVMRALKAHIKETGRRATIEYTLWREVNDLLVHARQLADLLPDSLVHVNLIAGNQVPGSPLLPALMSRVQAFARILTDRNFAVTIRKARGMDIQAACGELRSAQSGETNRCTEPESPREKSFPAIKRNRSSGESVRRRQR